MADGSSSVAFIYFVLCMQCFEAFSASYSPSIGHNIQVYQDVNVLRLQYLGLTLARCGAVMIRRFPGRWDSKTLDDWCTHTRNILRSFNEFCKAQEFDSRYLQRFKERDSERVVTKLGPSNAKNRFMETTEIIIQAYLIEAAGLLEDRPEKILAFRGIHIPYNPDEIENLILRIQWQTRIFESMLPPDIHILKNRCISREVEVFEDEALYVMLDINKLDVKSYFVEVMARDEMMIRMQLTRPFVDIRDQHKIVHAATWTKFSCRRSLKPLKFPGFVSYVAYTPPIQQLGQSTNDKERDRSSKTITPLQMQEGSDYSRKDLDKDHANSSQEEMMRMLSKQANSELVAWIMMRMQEKQVKSEFHPSSEDGKSLPISIDMVRLLDRQILGGQAESEPTQPMIEKEDGVTSKHELDVPKLHGKSDKEEKQPLSIDDKPSSARKLYKPRSKHERSKDDLERVTTWKNLAMICRSEENWKEARHWESQVMHMSAEIFGSLDPRTIASMINFCSTVKGLSKKSTSMLDIQKIENEIQERARELLKIDDPATLTGMGDLALTYRSYERWDEAMLIETYLIEQGQTLIQDERLADLLFHDSSLQKMYCQVLERLGAPEFLFRHDGILTEFIRHIKLESADNGLLQAIHLTQNESRRQKITERIIQNVENMKNSSKQAVIEQRRLLGFKPPLTLLTRAEAFISLRSMIENLANTPSTIKEALQLEDTKALQRMLETRFEMVTQDEFSWLRELIEAGYTHHELAELLLEQASDTPWIFFEPNSFEPIAISDASHVQGCAHEYFDSRKSVTVPSKLSVTKSSPARWKDITKVLEELCGLAGIIPSDQDRSKWNGSVRFEEQNSVAIVTHSQPQDDLESSQYVTMAFHIARIMKSLENFCLAAAHAQAAGLCCNSFTIVRVESESSVKLETIDFMLAEQMLGHLNHISNEPVHYGDIQRAAARILEPISGEDLYYNNYDIHDTLKKCSLATQVLCLGFLSYSQAHIGPIRPFFLDTPLEKVRLLGLGFTSAYNFTVEANLKQLTCLDGMVQSPVFVFSKIPKRSEATIQFTQEPRYDVLVNCANILDTWGPGHFFIDRETSLPYAIKIGNGIIYSTDPEISRYHWSSGISPGDIPRSSFDLSTEMIIGTPVIVNDQCNLDIEECRKRSSAFLEPMGTYRAYWMHDERQIGIQGGQYAVVQAIAAAHKMPGRNLKQHIIEQDDEMLLSFINELWGVQVSFCTHVARRVPLRELVSDLLPVLAAISSSSRDTISWEQLKKLDIIDAFQKDEIFEWMAKLPEHLHRKVLKMIRALFEALQHTGLDREKKNLVVAWPHERGIFKCFKVPLEKQTSWAGVLADSEDSAAFCYITTRCFETGKIKCSGPNPVWRGEIPLLETAVMLHARDRSALAAALQHDKACYFQKMDDLFFVKVQRPVSSGVANLITKRSIIPRSMQIRLFAKNGARLRERIAQGEFAEEVAVSYSPISSS